MPSPIPAARVVAAEDLTTLFIEARREYTLAWIQHKLLVRDNDRNPAFDESQSPFLETMAFYNARMTSYADQLAARGAAVPSRTCTVISLFLDDPDVAVPPVAEGQQAVEEPPIDDASEERLLAGVPLRASLEASWNRIDAAYLIAWVEMHLFLEDNPDATDEEIDASSFTQALLLRGRALEIVEQRLQAMGWQRPPPRLANELFPVLAAGAVDL